MSYRKHIGQRFKKSSNFLPTTKFIQPKESMQIEFAKFENDSDDDVRLRMRFQVK